jgi:sugar transferase (PEP-CTERM/EpsH1 system associated)
METNRTLCQVAEDARPLVMHIVYRFDTGGLENGVVNLINHLPAADFRHAVVALTEVTDFRHRVRHADVQYVSLHKPPGHGVRLYPHLFGLMRRVRPAIVHTRNLAALEAVAPAWAAGVPVRLHGEHGRDVVDLDGTNRRHQWARRMYRPFVTHYVALSAELADSLTKRCGVPPQRVTQLCNGVDTTRFCPATSAHGADALVGCPFDPKRHWIVGTVGRMQAVKDQPTLVRAFLRAIELMPSLRERVRLVMVGEGPLRAQCQSMLDQAGAKDLAWLPGERADVPEVMRAMHAFVLPSLAEGISNTILEAMASGLPVLATAVGGNCELVDEGRTGHLVAPTDVRSIAHFLAAWAHEPSHPAVFGRAGRMRAESRFSLQTMVDGYRDLYDRHLAGARPQLQRA